MASLIPDPTSTTTLTPAQVSMAVASSAVASLSSVLSSASAALKTQKVIAAGDKANPPAFKYIGLAMAVLSGLLIGSSFVFKKKGLLAAQKKYDTAAGEGHAYLKSPLWWTGMIIMVLGEVFNFVAYAFADAVLVTPLGALSVVICAILSFIFLKERLTLFGKVGCFLCIVGSTIIALNAPEQHTGGQIKEFQRLFIAPGFLTWAGCCITASLVLVFFFAPKYGKKHMLIYITVCSLIGGLSVSVTSGLGAAILLSIRGQNQFKYWFTYFLLGFVITTLLVEINYLNKALELFNTATVTPTYYVIFTGCTLITSIILQQGLQAPVTSILTLVLGFMVICAGIVLLQLSKIDPEQLQDQPGLDPNTTLLMRASRSIISHSEKGEEFVTDEPGVDSVRGGLGVVGSMIRARSSRRISNASSFGSRYFHSAADEYSLPSRHQAPLSARGNLTVERYQLHDNPISREASGLTLSVGLPSSRRETSISFAAQSDEPHGHHATAKDQQPGLHPNAALAPIREASAHSTESVILPQQQQQAKHLDPFPPTSGHPNQKIRDGNGKSSQGGGPSPPQSIPDDETIGEFGIRIITSPLGQTTDDDDSQIESPQREKVHRDYPKGKSGIGSSNIILHKRDASDESDGEQKQLLAVKKYK